MTTSAKLNALVGDFRADLFGVTKVKSYPALDFALGRNPGRFREGRQCQALRPDMDAYAVLSDQRAAVFREQDPAQALLAFRSVCASLIIPSSIIPQCKLADS